jgi:Holliday junction resolvase RusA-like endonuclease
MNSIIFTVDGEPKALKRHRDKKPIFKNGKYFTPKYDPSSADKNTFLALCKHHRPDSPIETPIALVMRFYFSIPKSYKKKFIEEKHIKRPDIDNLIKFVLDSLNGTFWKDDSVIYEISTIKLYKETPRTEIEIIY